MSEYPEDEFDAAGRDRGPQGVHREPQSLLRALAPFLAVLVLVPLLAWGTVSLLAGGDREDPQAQPVPAPVESTTGPTETPTEGAPTGEAPAPTDEETTPEETEEPEGEVVLTASVSVLNGAGVNGLAGRLAGELSAAGFTTVGAADYTAGTPDVTTLYYRSPELAATAREIGEVLGIENLVEAPSATQNVEIAVVLRADYAGR